MRRVPRQKAEAFKRERILRIYFLVLRVFKRPLNRERHEAIMLYCGIGWKLLLNAILWETRYVDHDEHHRDCDERRSSLMSRGCRTK